MERSQGYRADATDPAMLRPAPACAIQRQQPAVVAASGPRVASAFWPCLWPALAAVVLWILVFVTMAGIGGCGPSDAAVSTQPVSSQPVAMRWRDRVPTSQKHRYAHKGNEGRTCTSPIASAEQSRGSLLFLPVVGLTPVPPEDFARNEWPTVPGRYSLGETVYYRETWYNWQGLGRFDTDHGHRYFSTTRVGVQYGP